MRQVEVREWVVNEGKWKWINGDDLRQSLSGSGGWFNVDYCPNCERWVNERVEGSCKTFLWPYQFFRMVKLRVVAQYTDLGDSNSFIRVEYRCKITYFEFVEFKYLK